MEWHSVRVWLLTVLFLILCHPTASMGQADDSIGNLVDAENTRSNDELTLFATEFRTSMARPSLDSVANAENRIVRAMIADNELADFLRVSQDSRVSFRHVLDRMEQELRSLDRNEELFVRRATENEAELRKKVNEMLSNGATKSRLRLLAVRVSSQTAGFDPVPRFCYPVLIADTMDVETSELERLAAETDNLIAIFDDQELVLAEEGIREALSILPDAAQRRYAELTNPGNDLFNPAAFKGLNSIDSIRSEVVLLLLTAGELAKLELLDFQLQEIQEITARLANDEALIELQKKAELIESGNRAALPEGFDYAAEEKEIFDRVMREAASDIEDILLPQQNELLDDFCYRLHAANKSELPVEWPLIMAERLDLQQAEIEQLESVTAAEVEIFKSQTAELQAELYSRLNPHIPDVVRPVLEELDSVMEFEFSMDDLQDF
ncbi:MAG: hypothetical protein AAF456_18555 [Planctomycetota bacterium]